MGKIVRNDVGLGGGVSGCFLFFDQDLSVIICQDICGDAVGVAAEVGVGFHEAGGCVFLCFEAVIEVYVVYA